MATKYDLIIRNARIYDGTGNPWLHGSVAVNNGRIVAIGNLSTARGRVEHDARENILCPGFIDIHTHADSTISKTCSMEQYLRQGVTTIIGGNCGQSRYPIRDHLRSVSGLKKRINYGLLVGHGTIRKQVIGYNNHKASPVELAAMRKICANALTAGAFGISFGLYYAPGCYADEQEMVSLVEEVRKHHSLAAFHIRDESDYNIGLMASLKEVIAVAEKTKARIHISHLKCLGNAVWGQATAALSLIDEARAKGLDISFDQYPYNASSTSLQSALLPRWALEGGTEQFQVRVKDDKLLAQVREEVAQNINRRGGAENLLFANHSADTSINGKSLAEIALVKGKEPADAALELQLLGGARLVSFNMRDDDVSEIMRHPLGIVASDGSLVQPGSTVPHPRSYGTFARVLGKYVRESNTLPLAEAIRKMTSAPARRLGLVKRGLIAEGFYADLVVFDETAIRDTATFIEPHCYATGVELVVVNGRTVLQRGKLTANYPGWTLKKAVMH